jgi:exodeoxyribonuclease VII large subunit
MTDQPSLLDNPIAGQNLPEFTVSELVGGIKRTLETTFEHVRVRGEVSQPKYHSSGHLYFDLKDGDALINAVCWKARVGRLGLRLEEGMDVVVTGQVTNYSKTSRYQINIESVALAGAGALLKMLQDRKERLQKEGLFDSGRKRALPRFPRIIGIITSPTGAVIKDILHRLADRFPVRVILWPVAVQGDGAAVQIASAIAGMNALTGADTPDIIIVARGGGSLEDLMPFNEEVVVRAAAASRIPLISAVGHETDTTLIDYAADMRAPTPTAAAELATAVTRRDAYEFIQGQAAQAQRRLRALVETHGLRLGTTAHKLGDPKRYLEARMQTLDITADALANTVAHVLRERRQRAALLAARLQHPQALLKLSATRLQAAGQRLRAITRITDRAADHLRHAGAMLHSYSYERILSKGFALVRRPDGKLVTAAHDTKTDDAVQLTFADGTADAVIK